MPETIRKSLELVVTELRAAVLLRRVIEFQPGDPALLAMADELEAALLHAGEVPTDGELEAALQATGGIRVDPAPVQAERPMQTEIADHE